MTKKPYQLTEMQVDTAFKFGRNFGRKSKN